MAEEGLESVQYAIYSDTITATSVPPPSQQQEALLHDLRIAILHELQPLLDGYIWQHQAFKLAVVKGSLGFWHLAGSTRFGDNIEDEWFIVYLLKTVSERVAGISATVRDNDGEFLLIEAAYVIPRWLKPENSLNRVFLRGGCVHLVRKKVGEKSGNLTAEEAVVLMKVGVGATKASEEVQEAIARRIKAYPEQAQRNMHKARCLVPLPVAQVLKHEPQLVSLAVEAFYRRDIDAMKAASRLERFLLVEGSNGEMVETLVTMSRAMYAQLHQQMFAPPRKYPMPAVADPKFKQAELGMKLTCGLEMMYWECQRFEGDDVGMRDDGGILKGVEQAPVGDLGWEAYRKSLEKSGYFRDLLEGSREQKQLLQAAIANYRRTQSFAATSAAMQTPIKRVKDILLLQHTAADFSGASLPESDSDAWLYDGEDDLTIAIQERQAEIDAHESKRGMRPNPEGSTGEDDGDAQPGGTADEPLYDPEELVQGIQAFMSKISSYEGAELPGDEAVSINMSKFMEELESALGTGGQHSGAADAEEDDLDDSDWDSESDNSDEEMLNDDVDESRASSSMGVVTETASTSGASGDFMDEYSETLQHELRHSSLAKSFTTADAKDDPAKASGQPQQQKGDGDDDDRIVDVDINLVTSLLQSYMNQEGMPGPASNLLGAMGIKLVDPSAKNITKSGK